MRLEQQLASVDQCRKLKELGVKQDGVFSWLFNIANQRHEISTVPVDEIEFLAKTAHKKDSFGWKERLEKGVFSAWSVSELGVMLPNGYDTMRCVADEGTHSVWRGYDHDGNDFDNNEYLTEAECRAAMLIYLLESGKLKSDEINI